MDVRLDGKVALITGASKGIGLATAKMYAEAGASVMMVSRKIDESVIAEAGIRGDVAVHAANAGDVEQGERCVRATIERFGPIDILVNNAATPGVHHARNLRAEQVERVMRVNFHAPVALTLALLPRMQIGRAHV